MMVCQSTLFFPLLLLIFAFRKTKGGSECCSISYISKFAFISNESNQQNVNRCVEHKRRRRRRRRRRLLSLSSLNTSKQLEEDEGNGEKSRIRFLGRGERAIIRTGCVLVAPKFESGHFMTRSAIFLHGIGMDEEGRHVTRGVIIDHPTAFTMGEMGGGSIHGTLANNILFNGGDCGRDTAILLHKHGSILPSSSGPIGSSGIYEGGVNEAMEAVDEGLVDGDDFKFFFNFVEFTDEELSGMLGKVDEEEDGWVSLEIPCEMILDGDLNKGEAWRYLRNQVREMGV